MNFSPYITRLDYSTVIQDDQLDNQILDELNAGTRERKFAEAWAMSKIRGRIGDQFDLDYEFTPTSPYVFTDKYTGYSRITIDFPAWESGKDYLENDLVIKDGIGYINLRAGNETDWDESQWQGLGNQYDIYHIPFPYPRFSIDAQVVNGTTVRGIYDKGDIVFWNGHNYEALSPTPIFSQQEQLNNQNFLRRSNIFPNSPIKGYWRDLGAYEVTEELTVGTDDIPSVWTLGDNRDALFIQAVVDLSLYQLHKRIAPMNIPKLRIEAMRDTFEWLDNLSKGTETSLVYPIQPRQHNISWGSSPRVINGY